MNLYLAGTQGRRWCVDEYMNIYLAGLQGKTKGFVFDELKNGRIREGDSGCEFSLQETRLGGSQGLYDETIKDKLPFILESYYYADEWTENIIPLLDDKFLLDSGAFTFINSNKKSKIDFEEYMDGYIEFIKRNKVKYFFELDIDNIVGYEKVKEMRRRLEKETGKKCIPVWHKQRGWEEWEKLSEEYDYIALGGLAIKEIKQNEYKFIPQLLKTARKNNCKVHGLGFTNLKGLEKYKFYSVDSTSWTTGNRFGAVYQFNGKTMIKYSKKDGQRMVNPRELAIHNFKEWVKFSKYAETHL